MQAVVVAMGDSPFVRLKILYEGVHPPIIFGDKGALDALTALYVMMRAPVSKVFYVATMPGSKI
jgi:hypothetical protein